MHPLACGKTGFITHHATSSHLQTTLHSILQHSTSELFKIRKMSHVSTADKIPVFHPAVRHKSLTRHDDVGKAQLPRYGHSMCKHGGALASDLLDVSVQQLEGHRQA